MKIVSKCSCVFSFTVFMNAAIPIAAVLIVSMDFLNSANYEWIFKYKWCGIGEGEEQDASLLHTCSSSGREWKMPTWLLRLEAGQSMQHSPKLLREYELRFCKWNACEIWSLFPSLWQSTDGDVCLSVDICCPCSSDKKGWLLPISGICLPLPVSYPCVSVVPALKCG